MTNSNKILLSALLQIEKSLDKTEKIINSNNIPMNIHFDFSNIYDLFQVIVSAFNISEKDYDALYDLLDKFYQNDISEDKITDFIDSISSENQ